MSGHPAEPGSRPRRTTGPAITAAAAIIVLAVAACTSTSTPGTTGAPASAVAAASTGPGGHAPTLTGSGSTFDAPFFSVAFAKYQQQHPGVSISYAAVGSSAGIAAISARQVDFGASDVPMTTSEQAAAQGGPIAQVPVDLGGEGVAYNLALPIRCRLHLTGPVLAASPRPDQPLERPGHHRAQPRPVPPARADQRRPPLRRQRHHLHLQQLPLQHRPGLGRQVGTGKTLTWPTGEGAEGNGGVATAVNHTPFSIGYMEQAYSQGLLLHSPPSATRPGTTSPVRPDGHRGRRPETRHHPHRLLYGQPARRQQLPDQRVQLGAHLHPPNQPGHWKSPRQPHRLAHPHRPDLRCRNNYVPLPPESSNSPTPCSSR